ncbi:MAG: YggS family pyridoxal phosphate-dependent enzyme, partial [Actinomycetota bacterium]|nr:YggS family pyridoxal phosphate-dependent enzyme [Actinomycetota bacterium]
ASAVRLVAVAKSFAADVVLAAADAGIRDIGENRAQELKEKIAVVGDRVRWHFVGHLQTNKVRNVVGRAQLLHSVDRYGLAEAVARRAGSMGIEQDVLVEVNVGGETSKHGVEPGRAIALAEEIAALPGVSLRGLMTIPPATRDAEGARPFFQELAALRDRLVSSVPTASELSMGMSRDFEIAIEEGATIVRVGEAVFGPRSTKVT